MKKLFIFILFFVYPGCYTQGNDVVEFVDLGKFTQQSIELIISESNNNPLKENKVKIISENFLGVPYQGFTLIGSNNKQEVLTINLSGLDCFTYIDYVEALRHSTGFESFKNHVINIRYKESVVDYSARNHFFSDWPVYNSKYIEDVTGKIGGSNSVKENKFLNLKKDGTNYLSGIPVIEREITYIPYGDISSCITDKMNTGDYIGIYSDIEGLDVSHTGILIKKNGKAYIRHASSRKSNKKVLDEELLIYMKNKPGIVIYRPH